MHEVRKMQESRLFRIVYYLLENGRATAPELAEKFEVSVRTIYRDMDAISSAGIPIYAERGKGGGIFIRENYTLDKSLFSEQEREQILAALQGMAATGKNPDALLAKLSGLFRLKSAGWIEVDFSGWVHGEPRQELFDGIKEAIFQKKVISFGYFSSRGDYRIRSAKPIQLVFKSKDWYLYAFCLLRNDYRFFKLTRMRELAILPETFAEDFAPPKIEKRICVEKTVTVKLKFDRKAAFRVYDEFTDAITEDAQGNLYVEAELPDSEVLYSYILSFSDCAEVIAPQRIREQMRKKLQKMQEKYKT